MRVHLAGPDVLLPNGRALLAETRALTCRLAAVTACLEWLAARGS